MVQTRQCKSRNILKDYAIANPNTMNDLLFKYVFGSDRCKDITIAFLNDILGEVLKSPIKDLEFSQTEIPLEHTDVKEIRYDVSCNLKDGRLVQIEMQVRDEEDFDVRTLYYWARRFTYSLKKKKKYKDLPEVISLNILNFVHFEDKDEAFTHGTLVDTKTGKIIDNHISINFLEIPKFREHEDLTVQEMWMAYFHPKISMADKRRLTMNAPQIQSACDNVEKYFSNDERFQLYEDHELAQLDYESSLQNRYDKGHNDGVIEGRNEGRNEGRLEEKQDLVMTMLEHKYAMSEITLLSKFSEQEIREIAKKNGFFIP